ncbi:MAG: hypothetical protein H7175_23660, partial [Burkholderiales bacterium]|nr:hypothetical protein [Anaerolineae bacterium]
DIALHQRERENLLVAEIPFLKPIESMDIDELVRLPDRDSIDSTSLIVDDDASDLIGLPSVDSLNMDVLLWDDDTQRNRAISTADIAAADNGVVDDSDSVFRSKASDLANNGYSIFDEPASSEPELIAEPTFLEDDTQRNRAISDADIAASDIVAATVAAAETLESTEAESSYIADTDHGHHVEEIDQSEQPADSDAWSEDPPAPADGLDETPVDSAAEASEDIEDVPADTSPSDDEIASESNVSTTDDSDPEER